MQTIFKYNNKLFQCMNLQKKLKKMKLTEDSIEIIWQGEATQNELEKKYNELTNGIPKEDSSKLGIIHYHYKDINGNKRVSIFPIKDSKWIYTHKIEY